MSTPNLIGKISRGARLGKEFFWVAIGQAVAGLGGIAGVKLLTKAMSPSAYGEFSLALTGTILAQQCLGGPLGQAAMRFYGASREGGWTLDYLRGLNRLMLKMVGILAGTGALALVGCAIARHMDQAPFVLLALLLAAVTSYNIVCDAIQSGSRNRPVVALHQAAIQWLRPLGALAIFAFAARSFGSAVLGYLVATVVVLGSQVVFLVRQVKPFAKSGAKDMSDVERRLWEYAWPFASWGLLAWGQLASDRWFLELFRDAPSVAAYTVCYQLGYYPVLLITTAISNLVAPIVFEIAGAGNEQSRLRAASKANNLHIQAVVGITVLTTVASALFHSQIFRLLTTAAYAPYAKYLPALTASAGILAIGQAGSLVFLINARSDELTAAKCLTAVAGLLMNLGGAYWFGLPGAVGATLLFSLMYLGAIVRLLRKAAPHPEAELVPAWPENQVAEG